MKFYLTMILLLADSDLQYDLALSEYTRTRSHSLFD